MIEPVIGHGAPRAKATCCDCGRAEVVPCDYLRPGASGPRPNEGQVINKLTRQKWALVKGSLRCPACEARRKTGASQPEKVTLANPKEPAMAVAAKEPDLRQPAPAMKRQIIGLLEDAYDDDAKRYRNPADTDKTLAEVIGSGCLWGWVAAIREELFGPDTRNAEFEAIRAEVARLEGETKRIGIVVGDAMGDLRKVEAEQAALRARMEKAA